MADAEETDEPRGLIFDIQGFSLHDGPGTRTTVFMSGCPLSCAWCCNPEGMFPKPVLMRRELYCVECGHCIGECPLRAISVSTAGSMSFDRRFCDVCETMECVKACFHEALSVSGRWYEVEELLRILKRDRQFWGPRGGVTFSGGEPFVQPGFLKAALNRCRQSRIHTCIETTAAVGSEVFLDVMELVDWAFIDIKHMDPAAHRRFTGAGNSRVLENIRVLAGSEWPGFLVIRVPLIPGCNDSPENLRATAQFVKDSGLEVINLLPFHRLGESKYRQLGREYEFARQESVTLDGARRVVEEVGIVCYVGFESPF